MAWWQTLFVDRKAMALVREIDHCLEDAFMRSKLLPIERRDLVSTYMVQMILQIIPEYNFRSGFYVQFFVFAIKQPKEVLKMVSDTFSKIRDGARGHNEELEIVAEIIVCFLSLFAIESSTRVLKDARCEIYESRSRLMNDLIQSFLATKLYEFAGDWTRSQRFYLPA
jgi:hypothetical protein